MKHQYYGDVNDYRKYGLLRLIQQVTSLRLAVCWMVTPDDHRSDGKFTGYLASPMKWRRYDPQLFDALVKTVPAGRHLRHVEEGAILSGATLIEDVVPDSRSLRAEYFWRVRQYSSNADLVFFDPDNGIEVQSCPPGRKFSSKYITWDEVISTFRDGKSVLLYQHFKREERTAFIARVLHDLSLKTGAESVWCFRTPHVAFFLASQPPHTLGLIAAAKRIQTVWASQIDVVELDTQAVRELKVQHSMAR